ncbi:MAG: ATP synthase F0 subunit B [Acidobacteria bacterium]|nr:ATP synthase F0 subunit B [Acidobacteriota bacterium]
MTSTLLSLRDLLISAIPTIFFFVFLSIYLNVMLFRPIAKILEERKKATEGVRDLARRAYEAAESMTSQYQSALNLARAEIHQEHEALRRQWSEEEAAAMAKVRIESELQIQNARREIALEVQQEEAAAEKCAELLSESVVATLLQRRAA